MCLLLDAIHINIIASFSVKSFPKFMSICRSGSRRKVLTDTLWRVGIILEAARVQVSFVLNGGSFRTGEQVGFDFGEEGGLRQSVVTRFIISAGLA